MEFGIRKSFQVLTPPSSLRRRMAYSLAVVRLVLVPVIFLAVYYLFQIGRIVDRIVSFDACGLLAPLRLLSAITSSRRRKGCEPD